MDLIYCMYIVEVQHRVLLEETLMLIHIDIII